MLPQWKKYMWERFIFIHNIMGFFVGIDQYIPSHITDTDLDNDLGNKIKSFWINKIKLAR